MARPITKLSKLSAQPGPFLAAWDPGTTAAVTGDGTESAGEMYFNGEEVE